MQTFTDKAVDELVAGLFVLEAELTALRDIKDAAWAYVKELERQGPIRSGAGKALADALMRERQR